MPKITKQVGKKKVVKKTKRKTNNRMGVLNRIKPIGFEDDDGIKIILYGRSGTGKTTLWATFPKPILAVVCSGSSNPDELRSVDTKENRKHIEQVTLRSSSELSEVIEDQSSGEKFATLVVDHATGLQDLILKEILGVEEMPPQSSWGLASREQYGQCSLQFKTRMRELLDLSCNIVVVAQERTFEPSETISDLDIAPTIGAALSPSAAGWLNTASSYICQTFIRQKTKTKKIKVGGKEVSQAVKSKGVDYCLRTGPDAIYTTKFRMPKGTPLPDVIVDPNYGKIKGLIDQGA